MAPILEGSEVRKIAGCLYFYDLDQTAFGDLADLASIKPLPEDVL